MASFSHPRMFTYSMSLERKYYLTKLPRTHTDITVDAELLNSTVSGLLSVIDLCTGILHGCSVDTVKTYVQHYRDDRNNFTDMMRLATPALYYAIGRNSPEMVTLLLEFGMSSDGVDKTGHFIPALAFAIIYGDLHALDTTEVVKVLLAVGADPKTIPEDMWQNYMEMPKESWSSTKNQKKSGLKWCDMITRSYLAQGLNLSQRYYVHRASLCKPLTEREMQLAGLHDVTDLMKLPYRIIGQLPVLNNLQEKVLNHIASNTDSPDPLVMIFAGPPGHGKTELAKQLGDLLRVETTTIVCSQMKSDMELLGSKQGYHRSQEGSKLNNHLSQFNSACSVVFLDEFDKTSLDICGALLTVMSEGRYEDRRTNHDIDCSQTIWVLASNLGDKAIVDFYEANLKHLKDEEKQNADIESLLDQLRNAFESRIDSVVPFFPFSPSEQAVVAHKFLLGNAAKARKPIDLRDVVKRHMGHCHISFQNDSDVCIHMAKRGYRPSSGARGLKREAKKVEESARKVYNSVAGRVTEEMNNGPLEKLEVKLIAKGDNRHEIGVFRRHGGESTTQSELTCEEDEFQPVDY